MSRAKCQQTGAQARNVRAKDCTEKASPAKPVERLFPFVMRSRNLPVGRETLPGAKRRLHLVLITDDLRTEAETSAAPEIGHAKREIESRVNKFAQNLHVL